MHAPNRGVGALDARAPWEIHASGGMHARVGVSARDMRVCTGMDTPTWLFVRVGDARVWTRMEACARSVARLECYMRTSVRARKWTSAHKHCATCANRSCARLGAAGV